MWADVRPWKVRLDTSIGSCPSSSASSDDELRSSVLQEADNLHLSLLDHWIRCTSTWHEPWPSVAGPFSSETLRLFPWRYSPCHPQSLSTASSHTVLRQHPLQRLG